MAADPNAVPRAALNIGYQYQPVETRLNPPIQLPGTGELWAKVGQTALAAAGQFGDTLQKSALNPAVRAQIQYGVDQFKYGQDVIQHARATGDYGYLRTRTTPQGPEILAPAEAGQAFAPLYMPKVNPPPGTNPPPPAPVTAPGTGKEPQEKTTTQPKESQPPSDTKKIDPEHPENFDAETGNTPAQDIALNTQVPSRGGSTAALSAGPGSVLNTGQPQSSDIEAVPAAQYRAQQQGGSIWSPQRPAPIAPAAPVAAQDQSAQPSTPGTVPGSLSDQYAQQQKQQQLAQWQEQTMGQPMTADDAMAYMRRKTTLVQHATYMPHGGPQQDPAFAFGMKTPDGKSGGVNIVPVSQMVADGAGPSVAAQNTSLVLSKSDQLKQQQQNALAAPPAPEAAPQQGGNVEPLQQQPPAAPSTAYNPAPYQQAVAQAIANPQNLMAQEGQQAGTRTDIAAQPAEKPEVIPLSDQEKADFTPEAIAAARANAKPNPNQPANAAELDGSAGDPSMGDLGPLHLYRDDRNRTGELYAVRPGISTLFKQQRYYLGSDGWREYELPDSNMRLAMEAEYGGGKGGVSGVRTPKGNTFPVFDHKTLSDMSVPAMQGWLAKAANYHNTNGEANSNMEQRLTGLMDISQRTQRLTDGLDVAKKEGISPAAYNRNAQNMSQAARDRNAAMLPGQTLEDVYNKFPFGVTDFPRNAAEALSNPKIAWYDMWANGTDPNKFSDYLQEQVKRMNDDEAQLPGRQMALQRPEERGGGTSISVGGYGLNGTLKLGDGAGSSRSAHLAVDNVFADTPVDEAKGGLQNHKAEVDRQFEEAYSDAVTHNFRLTPAVVAYHNALVKHGVTLDENKTGNQFKDDNGQLVNPFRTTPKLDTTSSEAVDRFLKDHPEGGKVYNLDGQPRLIKPKR